MDVLGISVVDFGQWVQAASGVVPLLIGIGSSVFFKPWIYTENELESRFALAKERLTENLAKAHDNLILRLNLGEPARGGHSTADGIRPDLLADFSAELLRSSEFLSQIRLLRHEGTRAFSFLLLTFVLGLGLVIFGLIAMPLQLPTTLPYVFACSVFLMILQVTVILSLRRLKLELERQVDRI